MPSAQPPGAVFAMDPVHLPLLFPPPLVARLRRAAEIDPALVVQDFTDAAATPALADAEILITGWGCPRLDASTLAAVPRLRTVLHAAGSVRSLIGEELWARGVTVSSAAAANAVPVAEYTLAMILLTGKRVLETARDYRASRTRPDWLSTPRTVGNHRRTVGVLSASLIGRRVIELLRPHDVEVLLHDPFVDEAGAAELGVRSVGLAELFRRSDTVSVHTPLLPATRGLVGRELIDTMRPDAVLINTARGAVLDQDALADAALAGRIRAVLDVTDPEVLPPGHPLWQCDNVLLTPHLAGSQGNEWRRLAGLALSEIARWASGEGFLHPVRRERLAFLA